MKQQAIQYLAFDVHQATVVASLRDERGKVVMRATVPTEAKAILMLVSSAGSRVHVAFEEGTQAQWLHDLLVDHAERVIVCNVRGRSETTNKSDRIDADGLSDAPESRDAGGGRGPADPRGRPPRQVDHLNHYSSNCVHRGGLGRQNRC